MTNIRDEGINVGVSIQDLLTPEEVVEFLSKFITEENSDAVLNLLVEAVETGDRPLPWWVPTALARKVLDGLLPEGLLRVIRALLIKAL